MCKHRLAGIHEFLALCLREPVARCSHILVNTHELIYRLQDYRLPNTATLVVADIKAMYTNIDLDEATQVAARWLSGDSDVQRVLPWMRMEDWKRLIHTTLTHAMFSYDGKVYKPIYGLCMGSGSSPILANLTVAHREMEAMVSEDRHPKVLVYYRFYDDVFTIIDSQDREEIRHILNQAIAPRGAAGLPADPSSNRLQFDWDTAQILTGEDLQRTVGTFLDADIYTSRNDDGSFKLLFKMHLKRLSAYQYVPWRSGHPFANKKSIIKGELTRRRLLSSTRDEYVKAAAHLYLSLRERGYPHHLLTEAIGEVKYQDREEHITRVYQGI